MRKFLIIVLLFLTSFLYSTDYYVDATDGNDANTGLSPAQAWQTIGEVNSNMGSFNPNDNIYFQKTETWGGNTPLSITCSGTSGNPITFGAYGTGAKPAFNGATMIDPPINLRASVDYITVQDIYVYGYSGVGIYVGDTGYGWDTNIIISRCDVYNCTNGIYVDATNTFIIEDCTVNTMSNAGIVIYGSASYQVTNGIIRDCTAYSITQDGVVIHRYDSENAGANFYIYNCVAYDNGEQGFDITAGSNILVRDCETYGNDDSGYAIGHDVVRVYVEDCYGHDSDLSEFYIEDSDNVVIVKSIVDNPGRRSVEMRDECDDIYLANNTFISGPSAAREIFGVDYDTDYPDVIIARNNIFTEDASYPAEIIEYMSGLTPDNTNSDFDYNRYYRDGVTNLFLDSVEGVHNLSTRQSTYGEDNNSSVGDPDINYTTYELNTGSPCINAGSWLTTITSANGSGTSFVVADSNWFHDGFGLTTGSVIQLEGDSSSVTVTDINYGTDTITVNTSVSWTQGDGVAFAYSGSAPDIGAEEYDEEENTHNVILKSGVIKLLKSGIKIIIK